MRTVKSSALAALVLLSVAVPARAAGPRDTMLVTPAWLAQHIADPNLVLLHVGDKAEYDAKHIPNARYVTLRDIAASAEPPTLTLEMSPPDTLRTQLAALGISDNSHVVVYYAKDQVSPSTRVVFTLLYAGLDNVAVLDGGLPAWTAAGNQLTDAVPAAKTGTLSPLKIKPLVVDAEFVRTHATAPNFAVVDARLPAFYDGTQPGGPRDHQKAGHIPGAHSVPFVSLFTDANTLKPQEQLAAAFANAGVKPGDTVVAYCHIGQQATAVIFGARALGHPVLLYDGSFEDWARKDLPVENPAKK